MTDRSYEDMLRDRITELRLLKDVSEHRMSLDLNKSGSYIRRITSGDALPSVRELFNIIEYFEMTPSEFFSTFTKANPEFDPVYEVFHSLDESDREKVLTFIDWIQ